MKDREKEKENMKGEERRERERLRERGGRKGIISNNCSICQVW